MKRMLAGLFIGALLLYNGGARAEVDAKAAVLMEAKTGRVLYAQNAHEALPMASTTKIMTALLALEKGDLSQLVTAGPNAFGVPGTSIYLSQGEQLTLEELLYGLLLASGNDAAVAIAEHIGGTAEAFCRMMTERAAALGCENTVFSTPHGLPAQNHHTTACDLALITRAALALPAFRQIVSTQRASIPWAGHAYDRVLTNKNKLLSAYPGAIGVKTGYTRAAGRCLVFAAEREGMTLIGVALNCPDWFNQAAALLDWGFDRWQMVTLLSEGETVRQVPVDNGEKAQVAVTAGADLAAPVSVDAWPELAIELPDSLPAGLQAGQQVGWARLTDGGETLLTVPLLTKEAVAERSFLWSAGRVLGLWPLRP